MLNRNFYTAKMIKDLYQIGNSPFTGKTLNLLNGNYITFPNGDKKYSFLTGIMGNWRVVWVRS